MYTQLGIHYTRVDCFETLFCVNNELSHDSTDYCRHWEKFFTSDFFVEKNKQKMYICTYLFLRPIPYNHIMTTVDQIFHNTATHDTESEKSEFQFRRQDVLLLECL